MLKKIICSKDYLYPPLTSSKNNCPNQYIHKIRIFQSSCYVTSHERITIANFFSANRRNPNLSAETQARGRNPNLTTENQFNGQNPNLAVETQKEPIIKTIAVKTPKMNS